MQFLVDPSNDYEKCYRIGGDEYTAIHIGVLEEEEIQKRIRRIEDYLTYINQTSNKPYTISVSYGVSIEEPKGKTLDQIILMADKKMYEAKQLYKKRKRENL